MKSGPWLIDHQLGKDVEPLGNRHPSMAPHGVYPCDSDDCWVAIACPDDATWVALTNVLPLVGEADWDLATRIRHHDGIDAELSIWTAGRNAEQVADELQRHGVPAGPVNTTPQMIADTQVVERGFFVPLEPATPVPGNPLQMTDLNSDEWTRCPGLGEHNQEILSEWLGMSEREIDALQEQGVLADRPPA
jgi:crotonobetainyl-CoA:carnitine CoA-transferase CaiB-like acyl-CoA transferase